MTIHHSRGSYEIRHMAVHDALEGLPDQSHLITDTNVLAVYGGLIPDRVRRIAVPEGESSKSLHVAETLLRWLAGNADRKSTVVAFGGGVVGDLAGFVASTFMRGLPFIQIPTTLLAMVDSSVGGKVGIDLPEGKNLVGAFWPPVEVRVPFDTLSTLDVRQFHNGMAEVLKYGLILDAQLFEDLRRNPLTPSDERVEYVVTRCIELKAEVVTLDEFETTGLRAILNFGHTVAHAIEQVSGYAVLHGEAVAVGMVLESRIGEALGVTPPGTAEAILDSLRGFNLPDCRPWICRAQDMLDAMMRDKKAERGSLTFALLTQIGECKLVKDVPNDLVRKVLNDA